METVRLSDNERLITLTQAAYDRLQNENTELKQFQDSKTIRIVYGIGLTVRWDSYDLHRNQTITCVPSEQVLEEVGNVLSLIREENDEVREIVEGMVKGLNEGNKNAKRDREEEIKKANAEAQKIYASVPSFFRWWARVFGYGK